MKLIGKSIQNDDTEISTKKFVDRAIRGRNIFIEKKMRLNSFVCFF